MNDEAEDLPTIVCAKCARTWVLHDEPMFDADDDTDAVLCIECAEDSADELSQEFETWALENVRLTAEPHQFDPEGHWAPTAEAYGAGDREAYTENSVAASNRHRCTNYDELIADLDRFDPRDKALYRAIRARAHELIEERLDAMQDEELQETLDEVDAEFAQPDESDLTSREM